MIAQALEKIPYHQNINGKPDSVHLEQVKSYIFARLLQCEWNHGDIVDSLFMVDQLGVGYNPI